MVRISDLPEPVDVLAFGPHPDDVELWAGGLMLLMKNKGYRSVVVDLTRGEAGARGSAGTRAIEASAATARMGLVARENLELTDTRLDADGETVSRIGSVVRRWRPRLVVAPSERDLHPDHVAAAKVIGRGCSIAASLGDGEMGTPRHRVGALIRYTGQREEVPSFLVDVSAVWEQKLALVACYATQLGLDGASGPATNLTYPGFLAQYEARYAYWGSLLGVHYAEPFVVDGPLSIDDPVTALVPKRPAD